MINRLEPVRNAKTIMLTTYKRDGTPVGTPVSIAFDEGRAYFRSYDKAGKSKRLRRNPSVDAASCTFRGQVTGEHVHATARLLEAGHARTAARALARQHPVLQGVVVPMLHRIRRYKTLHFELEASERG